MMDASDIKSPKELEAFLNEWPEEDGPGGLSRKQAATWIAHRAAMRVLPVYWMQTRNTTGSARSVSSGGPALLPVLRANLISGLAARGLGSGPIKLIASDVLEAVLNAPHAGLAARTIRVLPRGAEHVIVAVASSVMTMDDDMRVIPAVSSAHALFSDTGDAEIALVSDLAKLQREGNLRKEPLWSSTRNPVEDVIDTLRKMPQNLGSDETARGATQEDWSFWIKWYDDALAGREPNWDMLEEIALIPSEIWEAGLVPITQEIRRLQNKYAIRASGNAERVLLNEENLYEIEVVSELPDNVFDIAKDRIRDAVAEMRAIPEGDNLRGACDDDLDRIENYLDRYSEIPLRIYEVAMRTIRHIDARCADGALPESDERLVDFRTELDNSALDILQSDEQVKGAVRRRASGRFDRLSPAEQEHYHALMTFLAENSVPVVAEEMLSDRDVATDPNAEDEDQQEARFRSGSRALRMREEAVRAADDVSKLGKGAGAVWDFVNTVASWFT